MSRSMVRMRRAGILVPTALAVALLLLGAPKAQAEDEPVPGGEVPPADAPEEPDAASEVERSGGDDPQEDTDSRSAIPFDPHWDDGLILVKGEDLPFLKLHLYAALSNYGVDDDDYTDASSNPNPTGAPGNNPRGGRMGDTSSNRPDVRLDVGVRGDLRPDVPIQVSFGASRRSYGIRDLFADFKPGPLPCVCLCDPEIRIGNFVEPYGLERNTELGLTTFMSRSAASMTFGLGHSLGVMAHDGLYGGRLGYAVGAFYSPEGEDDEFSNRETDETVVRDGRGATGRLWWMPWAGNGCPCRQVLFGVSGSVRTGMSSIRFRSRPESPTFDYAIDTDFSTDGMGRPLLDDASSATFLGAEASWVWGPWFAQAEYFQSTVDSTAGGNPTFRGGYVMAGCWLTGECRRIGCGWRQPAGICDPFELCTPDTGCGALELAARFSWVDLDDGNVRGGRMDAFSVELNWWLNDYARLMLNYVHARIDDGVVDEPVHVLQARFQIGL